MNKMKITSAAVRVYNSKGIGAITATGYSHQDCYNFLACAYDIYAQADPTKYDVVEGFLTNTETFVSRDEALEIVKQNGQLKDEYKNTTIYKLNSYMIDYVSREVNL